MDFGNSGRKETDGGVHRRKSSSGREKSPGRRMPSRAKGNAVYLAAAFLGISRSTMRHSATVMTMSTRV